MNKSELVRAISEVSGVSKKITDDVLSATVEVIQNAVVNGDKVTLVGFGTFEAKEFSAREGRNPSTGESISIPAGRKPKFSAGKSFKDLVDQPLPFTE